MNRILIVDDEENILNSCKRLMRKEDFLIETFSSPLEALKNIQQTTYAVIISDQRMPQMIGSTLLRKAKELQPESIRIILTGYADTQAAIDAINYGNVWRYLSKPWKDDELLQTIRQAMEHYKLIKENKELKELTLKQNEQLKVLNQGLEKVLVQRTEALKNLNLSISGQSTEIKIPFSHLQKNMLLSRNMVSQDGIVLLPKGTRILASHLETLRRLNESEQFFPDVHIVNEDKHC